MAETPSTPFLNAKPSSPPARSSHEGRAFEVQPPGITRTLAKEHIMDIKNLTQHAPTVDQACVTAVDPAALEFLNFSTPPSVEEIETRAYALACRANGYKFAMVGGTPT